jgi:uncharacterized protein (DUF169 family)
MDHVRVKFIDGLPEGQRAEEGQGTFCFWVNKARNGQDVYLTAANIDCELARYTLGCERNPNLAQVLLRWNDATTMDDAAKYIENTIAIPASQVIHLSTTIDDPDVVMHIGTPEEVMRVVRAYSRRGGRRVKGHLSALGAVCGELCAVPYMTQEPSLSVACGGSRERLFREHEIAVAFPAS